MIAVTTTRLWRPSRITLASLRFVFAPSLSGAGEFHVGVKGLGDIAVPNVDARTGEQNSICEGQLKFAGRLEAIPSCPDGPLIRNQAT
jgi:hypothetical protein